MRVYWGPKAESIITKNDMVVEVLRACACVVSNYV